MITRLQVLTLVVEQDDVLYYKEFSVRRLPVYLIVDCSESMAGEAIDAVNHGLKAMLSELRSNPEALETVHLSLLTFSDKARQVVPLTDLMSFQLPDLKVRAGTAMGEALSLLVHCMKSDVIRSTEDQKGDYRPLAFLLTDGQPTDEWTASANDLRSLNSPRPANLYAIGCGPDVDNSVLYKITDIVLNMPMTDADSFKKFFVWLSMSVQSASTSVGRDGIPLVITPPRELMVTAPTQSIPSKYPRQVFIPAKCQKSGKSYLMRFRRESEEPPYIAVCAHILDDHDGEGALRLPPVDASWLMGCPSCPHCGNKIAGQCPCGQLFCTNAEDSSVICPACSTHLSKGEGRSEVFINQSAG